jgi:hypothetical protein
LSPPGLFIRKILNLNFSENKFGIFSIKIFHIFLKIKRTQLALPQFLGPLLVDVFGLVLHLAVAPFELPLPPEWLAVQFHQPLWSSKLWLSMAPIFPEKSIESFHPKE